MKKNAMVLILGVLLSLVACKKETSVSLTGNEEARQEEIKTGVMDGVIKGDSWTFMSGKAKMDPFNPGHITLNFWENTEEDPCNVLFPTSKRNLISSVPSTVGTYELGNEMNVTFFYQSEAGSTNLIATEGLMVIDEVSEETVKGKLLAVYDDKNKVNGTFSLTLCK